jgi:hypothetical protein
MVRTEIDRAEMDDRGVRTVPANASSHLGATSPLETVILEQSVKPEMGIKWRVYNT